MRNHDTLSRRQLLQTMTALAGVAALPGCAKAARNTAWTPGLQLYTLGDAANKDFAGTLREVFSIGYRTVELPGNYGRPASELRKALDEVGLTCPSIHVGFQRFSSNWSFEDDLSKLADEVRTLGARYVVVPISWFSPQTREALKSRSKDGGKGKVMTVPREDWQRTADMLNEKGAVLARSGLRIGYHNHGMDFLPLPGGGTGLDVLIERTDPKIVDFQIDVGWVTTAGHDALKLLERLGSRVKLMHLKDTASVSDDPWQLASTDVGTGIVPWTRLIPAVQKAGVPHLFVEQEPPFQTTPMQATRVAFKYLSGVFQKVG